MEQYHNCESDDGQIILCYNRYSGLNTSGTIMKPEAPRTSGQPALSMPSLTMSNVLGALVRLVVLSGDTFAGLDNANTAQATKACQ